MFNVFYYFYLGYLESEKWEEEDLLFAGIEGPGFWAVGCVDVGGVGVGAAKINFKHERLLVFASHGFCKTRADVEVGCSGWESWPVTNWIDFIILILYILRRYASKQRQMIKLISLIISMCTQAFNQSGTVTLDLFELRSSHFKSNILINCIIRIIFYHLPESIFTL